MVNLIGAFERKLIEVRIIDMQEGTFYAEMVFDGNVRVSARPSDSIAVALRSDVPIIADEDVLTEAGLLIPEEDGGDGAPAKEDEVEKCREFLDSVSPDDFKASGGA